MVDLNTAIEELNNGTIVFEYPQDSGCTTPGEVVILLRRLAMLEMRLDKAEKALTRFVDNYYTDENGISLDYDSCAIMASEILRGEYEPLPCDQCTGSTCKDCNERRHCITWQE